MWPFAKTAGAATGPSPVAAPVPLCEQGPKVVGVGASVIAGASAPADQRVRDDGQVIIVVAHFKDPQRKLTYERSVDALDDLTSTLIKSGASRVELEPEWTKARAS